MKSTVSHWYSIVIQLKMIVIEVPDFSYVCPQTYMKSYSFVFFASICLVGFLYTFFLLPETKEKTILQIAEEFKAITVCGKSFAERKRMETKL